MVEVVRFWMDGMSGLIADRFQVIEDEIDNTSSENLCRATISGGSYSTLINADNADLVNRDRQL